MVRRTQRNYVTDVDYLDSIKGWNDEMIKWWNVIVNIDPNLDPIFAL